MSNKKYSCRFSAVTFSGIISSQSASNLYNLDLHCSKLFLCPHMACSHCNYFGLISKVQVNEISNILVHFISLLIYII